MNPTRLTPQPQMRAAKECKVRRDTNPFPCVPCVLWRPILCLEKDLHDCSTDRLIKRLREGFRPFVIRLTDGRSFPIPHPEFIAVGRHAVVMVDKEGDLVYIDPLHIVSVDEKSSKKNGRSSRS